MEEKDSKAQPWPAGFEFVRLLAERSNSTVALARVKEGGLVVIKRLRIASSAAAGEVLARHRRLQKLTHHEGLLPILDCGLTPDEQWFWESLPLADDLNGAHPGEESDYTPATLRLRVIERGPFDASATAQVGASLCEGLARLHEAGLVHRDIKPGNILLVGGAAKLGDYGLVCEPGRPFDFNGTEGFQPVEGGADQAADLFALGKTLYEAWTGCDRLEFPSLPKRILESADWNPHGQRLNAALLRACHQHASAGFDSAGEFRRELMRAAVSTPVGLDRRRVLFGVLAGSAALSLGFLLWLRHPRPKASRVTARWELLRRWDHIPELWTKRYLAVDASDKIVYSFHCQNGGGALYTFHLETLELKSRPLRARFDETASGWLLHPLERTLWRAAGGRGALWRLDPRSGEFSQVGGSGASDKDLSNTAYWNPVTQRFGVMGGYGQLRVHNWRWEFDQTRGEWLEVEADEPGREPWPRADAWLLPHNVDSRMFFFGGVGNSTGRQGQRDPGFKNFDSHFHRLGDLWSFDFVANRWSSLVPLPGLETRKESLAAYFPLLHAVVAVEGCLPADPYPTPPRVHVFRAGVDTKFTEATLVGSVPDGRSGCFVCYDPVGARLLCFVEEGIYGIRLEAG